MLAFLGLDDDGRSEFPVANGAHGHRSGLVARLLLHPPKPLENAVLAFRSYLREKRPPWVERVKALLNRPEKRAELDPAFRDELQRYFSEDQIRLQAAMASMNSSS